MKKSIPQYTFYKNKYGSRLLIDVVELKDIKKYLTESKAHALTYYDITFITEGSGFFTIDNRSYEAIPCDAFFSKPGEVRSWDTKNIVNGYALIFEDEFLSSFFKDPLFVQHLSFFNLEKTSVKLHLPSETYVRLLQLLKNIREEIDTFKQNDEHVLRALLYEALMLLNRIYLKLVIEGKSDNKDSSNLYVGKFIKLVYQNLKEQHSVRFYADELCITPNYLNEIITRAMRISAKQYIRGKMMDEAKRLLVYTDLSVSEIALELGYSTVSYFVRSFRQFTQKTPLLYREENKP